MSAEELRETLARLHQELQRTPSLDREAQQLVMEISADIARLARPGTAPAADHTSRLESLAVRFESGHPALAASVRQIIDVLGKAGV
jgi:hypothetical protein